jgi:hypothetical protein
MFYMFNIGIRLGINILIYRANGFLNSVLKWHLPIQHVPASINGEWKAPPTFSFKARLAPAAVIFRRRHQHRQLCLILPAGPGSYSLPVQQHQ